MLHAATVFMIEYSESVFLIQFLSSRLQTFVSYHKLDNFFKILSTNTAEDGTEFVSTIEGLLCFHACTLVHLSKLLNRYWFLGLAKLPPFFVHYSLQKASILKFVMGTLLKISLSLFA